MSEAIVTLTWAANPPMDNVVSYVVSELLVPGRSVVGVTPSTSLVLHNVSNGEHKYVVSAVNSHGEGIPSMPVVVNIFNYPIASPGIPGSVNAAVNYTFP